MTNTGRHTGGKQWDAARHNHHHSGPLDPAPHGGLGEAYKGKPKPTCRACGSDNMRYMGTQKLAHGRLLDGYHCQNPACNLFDSWQSVEEK
jgi:hypothetical protein